MSAHSSIYVAPLQFGSIRSGATSSASTYSRPSSSKGNALYPIQAHTQMTPPATPHGSQEDLLPQPEAPEPVFHSYLRAFCQFHPSYAGTSSTVTLPLAQGDVILVHSIHTNGWADGTLLISGARGWLPTNYCEAYDHDHIRNLLKALLNFWDLLRGRTSTQLDVFRGQEYIRGLIAGVRFLLEKSNCLTRESPIVRSRDGLRRNRKALLSDLSSLVKCAKRLSDVANGLEVSDNIEDMVDEMIMKAFKIVTRGVKFLDIWNEDAAPRAPSMVSMEVAAATYGVPPTPPAESISFGQSTASQTEAETSSYSIATADVQTTNSISDARSIDHGQDRVNQNSQNRCSQSQFGGSRPATSHSNKISSRPNSLQVKRQSISHRISHSGQTMSSQSSNLASERLKATHDAFLTSQASFVGRLHLQSRSSSELLLTTQQSVKACQDLLAIVDAVWDRDLQRSESLQDAKDAMCRRITDLMRVTRDTFTPTDSYDDDEAVLPDQGWALMTAATNCVKAAGECVAKTKFVLERIGDFEFEPVGLGISTPDEDVHPTEYQSDDQLHVQERQMSEDTIMPPPPQPIQRPPPPPEPRHSAQALTIDIASEVSSLSVASPSTLEFPSPDRASRRSLLPPLPSMASPLISEFGSADSDGHPPLSSRPFDNSDLTINGDTTAGLSNDGTNSTHLVGNRNSDPSIKSQTSTRATTPDHAGHGRSISPFRDASQSMTSSQTTLAEEFEETEATMLEKTFAHELIHNKDGQITGGTLPALIERLTTHDSTPDSTFVSTFYLTFRLFTTPMKFAEALVHRFDYVAESPHVAKTVRLRVYNVFKGWIESHWRSDFDREALDIIYTFAIQKLSVVVPSAGKRLIDLADKVAAADAPLVPRLVSSIGKTNTSISQYVSPDTPLPQPIITKSQLNSLKNWKLTGHPLSILDFDPLELARQFTLKESRIFCSILPEELLGTEWMKKSGSNAPNVRAMSTLSTDLATLVADTILAPEDLKKRAATIKQWVKIAKKCLGLNNYDSVMAIICSLNSSTISRLKKTWEVVSQKTKATLENLKSIVDVSKNYLVLRQRLQGHVPPCLPFVGIYLTDLTFVDVGNQTTRQLPSDGVNGGMSVINFGKHMQTAKIIGELQRFQIPYRFTDVPELQEWMDAQILRVQTSDEANIQNYYRRSLRLEPREQAPSRPSPPEPSNSSFTNIVSEKQKFDFLPSWTHSSRDKSIAAAQTATQ